MAVLEKSIVIAITRKMKKLGVDCEKSHGGLFGSAGKADLYLLVPVDYQRFPVPVYFEIKVPGKHSTPLQEAWAHRKRKYGAPVFEVHSAEEAEKIIEKIRENNHA